MRVRFCGLIPLGSALRRFLTSRARTAVEARDLERINRASDRLNAEVADVLDYQALEEE